MKMHTHTYVLIHEAYTYIESKTVIHNVCYTETTSYVHRIR